MLKYLLLSYFVLFSIFIYAQEKPQIGSTKNDREKLLLIKKGLPNIKKNLTKLVDNYSDERELKVIIGNEICRYNEWDNEQSITYYFSRLDFNGTTEEFKAYYQKLLGTINDVYGDKYDSLESVKKEKKSCVSFYEKGKKWKSPTSIYICCDWISPSVGPEITLSFFWRKGD